MFVVPLFFFFFLTYQSYKYSGSRGHWLPPSQTRVFLFSKCMRRNPASKSGHSSDMQLSPLNLQVMPPLLAVMCGAESTQPDCPGTPWVPEVTSKPTSTVWKSVVLGMHPLTLYPVTLKALDFTQLHHTDNNLFREYYLSQESNVWSLLRSSAGNSHRK